MSKLQNKEVIYVGIRSTGTETLARIEHTDGMLLGTGRAGTANICYSVTEAWHAVSDAFHDALSEALIDLNLDGEKYEFHAGLGIKGTEIEEKVVEFTTTKHPFKTLVLQSDGYVDCLGAHNGKNGSVIVIDEGVVAYLVEDEKLEKLGGWGFPHSDEGSAAWLGCQAVALTFQWQDGHIPESPLLELILTRFNHKLSEVVKFATSALPKHYASLATLVIEQSKKEDIYAVKLMQQAASHIEKVFEGINKKAVDKNLPCCLFGGLSEVIKPWLSKEMQNRLIEPHADGTKGAIMMLKNHLAKENQAEGN